MSAVERTWKNVRIPGDRTSHGIGRPRMDHGRSSTVLIKRSQLWNVLSTVSLKPISADGKNADVTLGYCKKWTRNFTTYGKLQRPNNGGVRMLLLFAMSLSVYHSLHQYFSCRALNYPPPFLLLSFTWYTNAQVQVRCCARPGITRNSSAIAERPRCRVG